MKTHQSQGHEIGPDLADVALSMTSPLLRGFSYAITINISKSSSIASQTVSIVRSSCKLILSVHFQLFCIILIPVQ